MTPKYWLIGSAALLAVFLVISIALGLTREEKPLPEGTPERTVQLFLLAAKDGDIAKAHGYLSSSVRERCPLGSPDGQHMKDRMADQRITMDGAVTTGDTAVVTVLVTLARSDLSLFPSPGHSFDRRYSLLMEDEAWLLDEFAWPLTGCPNEARAPAPPQVVVPITPTPRAR